MLARIGKSYSFAAAHHLPNHDGKCREPHGHTYQLHVEVEGPTVGRAGDPKEGMVMDYADLDAVVQPLVDLVDHTDLNVSLAPVCSPTTAENLALFFLDQLRQAGLPVHRVTVQESPRTWATVRP